MEKRRMKNVTLNNTDQGDLYVKAWDFNQTDDQGNPNSVLDRTRLNQGQQATIAVQEDGSGDIHFKWWAQRADDASKTAEHESTDTSTDVTTFFG
jgi:hypothetical protein